MFRMSTSRGKQGVGPMSEWDVEQKAGKRKRRSALSLAGLVLSVGAGVPFVAGSAQAQTVTDSLSLQQFVPSPTTELNYMHVRGADTLGTLKTSFGLYLNYAQSPLVYTASGIVTPIVAHQVEADLLAAIGLWGGTQLGVVVPVSYQVAGPGAETLGVTSLSSLVPGDIRLVPRWKAFGKDRGPALAIEAVISLPTGSEADLQGELEVAFEPKVALEWRFAERLRAAANVGYLVRTPHQFSTLDVGSEVTFGGGVAFDIRPDKLTLVAEAQGKASSDTDDNKTGTILPSELDVALRRTLMPGHSFTLGLGTGLTNDYGTPTLRVIAGYNVIDRSAGPSDADKDGIIDTKDTCAKEPEDLDSFQDDDGCPDRDNDADGILDATDKCPNDAEDADRFMDEDGCPDPDNDEDGVLDASDKCADSKEDMDKFQDEDGCIDPDNDVDGLRDGDDKCPNKAEDFDQLGDEDGCPEEDFDRDGVADTVDKCPRKPEVINGVDDEDGCPDKGASKVEITADSIKILDKVYFDTGKATLQKRSFSILNQVASVLKANPEITKIRVEGHTDSQGNADKNQVLSQDRTESVRKYLIERGIAAERLEAMGYGQTRPIADNKTEAGREQNRRVEFKVLEMNGKPIETTPAPAAPAAPAAEEKK